MLVDAWTQRTTAMGESRWRSSEPSCRYWARREGAEEAEEAAKNEYKEDTGVMLEEEEMVFLSLMYNRGDVETDSEIASLAVRQRRGRRRAHTIRKRRATATKTRRETMAK